MVSDSEDCNANILPRIRNIPTADTTLYFDTPDRQMYAEHQRGRKNRQKIRVRRYESSGVSFLEVKRKNNKGRTDKKRMEIADRVPQPSEYSELQVNYCPSGVSRILPAP